VRVPLAWLREFAPTDLPPEDLADLLTARGVKVEDVFRPWDGLHGVVAARVLEVRDHPDSTKLCLARIQHPAGEAELVVGVRNIGPGDLVPWAPPGARVPSLPEALSARTIRGVESAGMLCSPYELGLSPDHGGILVLNGEGVEVGADVKSALGLDDAVLDIEVEPNRPDFLSVYGVAREVAAATDVPLTPPATDVEETHERAAAAVTVRIDAPNECPRYLGRVLRGIVDRPSPLRAQARLTAAGMRPISAVVDATNYTMLELGQPIHGFDLERLAGPGIVVRRAGDGERVTTLDGVERRLEPGDLLICDLDQPVAIAGVMGGATSEVSPETSDVLLESAYFARGAILRTARRLGLHTEASHRFERGTDPEGLDSAAARCAGLISAWTGASVAAGVAEAGQIPPRRHVAMRSSRAAMLLGYPVTVEDSVAAFESLRLPVRVVDADRVEVEVPGYRVDLEQEVDLIDEVVRTQGYDGVGSSLPRSPHPGGVPEEYAFARGLKDVLVRAGLREVRPAPFVSEDDLAVSTESAAEAVPVANPLRADEGFLRTELLPGLLRAIARNRAGGVRSVAVFEVGAVFRLAEPSEERRKVGFALSGPAGEGWAADDRAYDVLDARGVLEMLLDEAGVEDWTLGEPAPEPFHPGRSAWVLVAGSRAGVLGEIHPRVASALDLDGRIAVCELEVGALRAGASKEFVFRDIPRFPPARRDLAFVVDERVPAGAVQAALEDAAGHLLGRAVLFDVFRGGSLPAGSKSLAFALDVRAADRTLTDDEAQTVVDRIAARLAEDFGAELRSR
jgi:phenylalanyl-tRNA synthetase beta chain